MKQGAEVENWGIKAGMNLALFLLVGYTTCEYYEYKQKKDKTILENNAPANPCGLIAKTFFSGF